MRLILTLESLQWIRVLVFHSMVISSGYTVIYTKGFKSNFLVKSLHVDDLLIVRNGIELPSQA